MSRKENKELNQSSLATCILLPLRLNDHPGPNMSIKYRSYSFMRLLGVFSSSLPVGSPVYSNDRTFGCSEMYLRITATTVDMTRKTSPLFTTTYSSPSYSSFNTPNAMVQWRRLSFFRANRTSYSNPDPDKKRYTLPDVMAGGVNEYGASSDDKL